MRVEALVNLLQDLSTQHVSFLIPVHDQSKQYLCDMRLDDLECQQRLKVILIWRGHAKRVYLRPIVCRTSALLPRGSSQSLPQDVGGAYVQALKGLYGSA